MPKELKNYIISFLIFAIALSANLIPYRKINASVEGNSTPVVRYPSICEFHAPSYANPSDSKSLASDCKNLKDIYDAALGEIYAAREIARMINPLQGGYGNPLLTCHTNCGVGFSPAPLAEISLDVCQFICDILAGGACSAIQGVFNTGDVINDVMNIFNTIKNIVSFLGTTQDIIFGTPTTTASGKKKNIGGIFGEGGIWDQGKHLWSEATNTWNEFTQIDWSDFISSGLFVGHFLTFVDDFEQLTEDVQSISATTTKAGNDLKNVYQELVTDFQITGGQLASTTEFLKDFATQANNLDITVSQYFSQVNIDLGDITTTATTVQNTSFSKHRVFQAVDNIQNEIRQNKRTINSLVGKITPIVQKLKNQNNTVAENIDYVSQVVIPSKNLSSVVDNMTSNILNNTATITAQYQKLDDTDSNKTKLRDYTNNLNNETNQLDRKVKGIYPIAKKVEDSLPEYERQSLKLQKISENLKNKTQSFNEELPMIVFDLLTFGGGDPTEKDASATDLMSSFTASTTALITSTQAFATSLRDFINAREYSPLLVLSLMGSASNTQEAIILFEKARPVFNNTILPELLKLNSTANEFFFMIDAYKLVQDALTFKDNIMALLTKANNALQGINTTTTLTTTTFAKTGGIGGSTKFTMGSFSGQLNFFLSNLKCNTHPSTGYGNSIYLYPDMSMGIDLVKSYADRIQNKLNDIHNPTVKGIASQINLHSGYLGLKGGVDIFQAHGAKVSCGPSLCMIPACFSGLPFGFAPFMNFDLYVSWVLAGYINWQADQLEAIISS